MTQTFHGLRVEGLRVLRFGIVGLVGTATYGLVTLGAIELLHVPAVPSSVLGVAASIGISYLGHAFYSFRVNGEHSSFVWRFLLLASVNFVLSTSLMWLLTDFLTVGHRLAIVIIVSVIPLFSFICNRFWVFRTGLSYSAGHDHVAS